MKEIQAGKILDDTIGNKSTSGSPKSDNVAKVRKMPKDLGKYIDFDSPI